MGHQPAINRVAVNTLFYRYLSLRLPTAPSCRCTPLSSPSQTPVRQARAAGRAGGGKGRNPDVLMEIQLSKVKCIFVQNKCSCVTLQSGNSHQIICFISTGEVSARRVPTDPRGCRANSRPASLPPGVCRARPGDPGPTGCLPDEQVPLLVLQQGNASESSFQHGREADLRCIKPKSVWTRL